MWHAQGAPAAQDCILYNSVWRTALPVENYWETVQKIYVYLYDWTLLEGNSDQTEFELSHNFKIDGRDPNLLLHIKEADLLESIMWASN